MSKPYRQATRPMGEGWRLLPDHYDDGGLSGASLDRPALQALLAELRARKIDVVVVYKVDRLTRSLALPGPRIGEQLLGTSVPNISVDGVGQR
jgi:site-specific DNA recombinase